MPPGVSIGPLPGGPGLNLATGQGYTRDPDHSSGIRMGLNPASKQAGPAHAIRNCSQKEAKLPITSSLWTDTWVQDKCFFFFLSLADTDMVPVPELTCSLLGGAEGGVDRAPFSAEGVRPTRWMSPGETGAVGGAGGKAGADGRTRPQTGAHAGVQKWCFQHLEISQKMQVPSFS